MSTKEIEYIKQESHMTVAFPAFDKVFDQVYTVALIGDNVSQSLRAPSFEVPVHPNENMGKNKDEEDLAMEIVEHELLGHILGPIWAMIKAQSEIQSEKKPIESTNQASKIDPKLRGDVRSSLMVAPRLQDKEKPRGLLIDFSGADEMKSLRPR